MEMMMTKAVSNFPGVMAVLKSTRPRRGSLQQWKRRNFVESILGRRERERNENVSLSIVRVTIQRLWSHSLSLSLSGTCMIHKMTVCTQMEWNWEEMLERRGGRMNSDFMTVPITRLLGSKECLSLSLAFTHTCITHIFHCISCACTYTILLILCQTFLSLNPVLQKVLKSEPYFSWLSFFNFALVFNRWHLYHHLSGSQSLLWSSLELNFFYWANTSKRTAERYLEDLKEWQGKTKERLKKVSKHLFFVGEFKSSSLKPFPNFLGTWDSKWWGR